MYSLVAHDKIQPAYGDNEIIIWDRLISKNATTEALEVLGDTNNFICIFLKLFEDNYDAICVAYSTDMKEMFKQIPLTIIK